MQKVHRLTVNDLAIIDLKKHLGDAHEQLPVVLRLLAENIIRKQSGDTREQALAAILAWLARRQSEAEIPFVPARVLMHDTTSTPALVDIAAMRDALAEAGQDPQLLNPSIPVDISVDHSLAVEAYAQSDAASINLQHELRRNQERYRFLKWAAKSLDNVRVHPPGTGIMHTINLEQLATVVRVEGEMAAPEMMLGTDSHTPMINGIGVLGWGVGGLEAQTVMFGLPTMLRIPEVIGVELTGKLPAAVLATDLALTVTKILRDLGVTGEFVEFFGPGVASLSAGERAVVANMAPEYGASTGYFPVDENTLHYLRQTGRSEEHCAFVKAVLQAQGLWFDPLAKPAYSKHVHIDLSRISQSAAGPQRPQDLLAIVEIPKSLPKEKQCPIAYAAITSCTNTSDPRLLVAAGLLARKARALGLHAANGVKTSLTPGSPAAAHYLKRAGLLDDLSALGFDIAGFGCATCIGNPGPLPEGLKQDELHQPVAILSGNRNFPGRVHPELSLAFIMSPPLVVAYAIAGDAKRNLITDGVGEIEGRRINLEEIWPSGAEIDMALSAGLQTQDFSHAFTQATRNQAWQDLESPRGACYPWEASSTNLRPPPFASPKQSAFFAPQLGRYTAQPLLLLDDDVTTDHLSPASAIPSNSLVADFLVSRGEQRHDLNVFASRRGNWEVMLRAAFHAKTLRNHLAKDLPVAHTMHVPSGEVMPIWQVAERYRAAKQSVVVVAGERYGMGSSRDWAAKGQRLLGIRAVLAMSFERIHRANLIGMGILPLVLSEPLSIQAGEQIIIHADNIAPRETVSVALITLDGRQVPIAAKAAVETQMEVSLLIAGGVIPYILRQHLN